MRVLDTLDLNGNLIINAYLDGIARQVSNSIQFVTKSPTGEELQEYDGSDKVVIKLDPSSLGAISTITVGTKDYPARGGKVSLPEIAGPQGVQGIQGIQGIQGTKANLTEVMFKPVRIPNSSIKVGIGDYKRGYMFPDEGETILEVLDKILYPTINTTATIESNYSDIQVVGAEIIDPVLTETYNIGSQVDLRIQYLIDNVELYSRDVTQIKLDPSKLTDQKSKVLTNRFDSSSPKVYELKMNIYSPDGSFISSATTNINIILPTYHLVLLENQDPEQIIERDINYFTENKTGSINEIRVQDQSINKFMGVKFAIAVPDGVRIKIIDLNGFDVTNSYSRKSVDLNLSTGKSWKYTLYTSNVTYQDGSYYVTYTQIS